MRPVSPSATKPARFSEIRGAVLPQSVYISTDRAKPNYPRQFSLAVGGKSFYARWFLHTGNIHPGNSARVDANINISILYFSS